ncbi:MAG: hypothetical protein ONB23_04805 [candidate division KSB1 bacterium]|nr:hypothetical protein [candidate division KSB1 bacterium]
MIRLIFQLLFLYAIYKIIRWIVHSGKSSLTGGNPRAGIADEEIEDAEYREIKD